MKLHIQLLKLLLKRIDYIITQTEMVKDGLVKVLNKSPQNIKVVNNVLPAIYSTINPEHVDSKDNWVEIPAIGGGEHKNLDIIPDVVKNLEKKYGITNYRFHITLPSSSPVLRIIEKKIQEYKISDRIVNHGNLKQDALANLYKSSFMSFLPSVLEVFSASTVEAVYFQLPTVATSLPFNTEVFGDSCLYYEPMNASEAADQIHKAVTDDKIREQLKSKMKTKLEQFSSFEKYFKDTVDYLVHVGQS